MPSGKRPEGDIFLRRLTDNNMKYVNVGVAAAFLLSASSLVLVGNIYVKWRQQEEEALQRSSALGNAALPNAPSNEDKIGIPKPVQHESVNSNIRSSHADPSAQMKRDEYALHLATIEVGQTVAVGGIENPIPVSRLSEKTFLVGWSAVDVPPRISPASAASNLATIFPTLVAAFDSVDGWDVGTTTGLEARGYTGNQTVFSTTGYIITVDMKGSVNLGR